MENEKLNSRGKRETTKDSMYREKLLEYMEKEYERQDEQNEKITSRVSISVSVATAVIFILPSVISVPSLPSLRGVYRCDSLDFYRIGSGTPFWPADYVEKV